MTRGLVGWRHNDTENGYTFYYSRCDSYPSELGKQFIHWVVQSNEYIEQFSKFVKMNLGDNNKEFDGKNFDFEFLKHCSTLFDYVYILDLVEGIIKIGHGHYKYNEIIGTDEWEKLDVDKRFEKEYVFCNITLSDCLKMKWDWKDIFSKTGFRIE